MRLWLAALALLALAGAAHAAATSQCGPTSVGTGATPITFPASGTQGPTAPSISLSIMVPTGTAYLCVNPTGTAATSGSGCAAGSFYVGALSPPLWWSSRSAPPPAAPSVVASGSSTPMTCVYQ